MPPAAHEIAQNSIRAVAAAGSERAQLVAFTKGMDLLTSGQSASTSQLVRAAMTGLASGLDPHSAYDLQVTQYSGPELSCSVHNSVALIRPLAFTPSVLPKLRKTLVDSTAQAGGHLLGLVLDLQDSEGGFFSVATDMAGLLLQAGDLVVAQQGRNTAENRVTRASGGSLPIDTPIIVLVNGGTSSGAELVAAALGDNRALLLGSRTFGRGTVQTVTPLPREAGGTFPGYIRLTTTQMFAPNGQSWQRRGLTPDILIQPAPGMNKPREDSLPGALPTPPDISASTRLNPLRARLAQIIPSLLPTPNPADPTTDFAMEQALRAISLLQPTAAP